MNAPGDALKGLRLLITRPQPQADALAQQVRAQGGEALIYPTVRIEQDATHIAHLTGASDTHWDWVMVTSQHSWDAYQQARRPLTSTHWAAVGASTAGMMMHDLSPHEHVLFPQDPGSEGLLALPALHARKIQGKNILILGGEHPRPLLENTLRQREALVTFAPIYRRSLPASDWAQACAQWQAEPPTAFTATSQACVEGLNTVLQRHGMLALWQRMTCLAASERIADFCRAHGYGRAVRLWPQLINATL